MPRSRSHCLLPPALLLLVAACSLQSAPQRPELAFTCQTRPCECVSERRGLLRQPVTGEPQWRPSGEAYCEEGFVLRRVKKPK